MERSVEVQGWGGTVRTRILLPDDGAMPDFIKKRHQLHSTAQHSLGMSDSSGSDFVVGMSVDLSQDAQANSPLGGRPTG
jgi:hypothetical protein